MVALVLSCHAIPITFVVYAEFIRPLDWLLLT